jgi:hypothetical protein
MFLKVIDRRRRRRANFRLRLRQSFNTGGASRYDQSLIEKS